METPEITLVIPMYNESGIIKDTALTLDKYMREHFESYEILFSDDGSTDGSAEKIRELALDSVRVIGYETNRGKGSAVRHAMLEAKGQIIMFTDADLAYGTEVIKTAYDKMLSEPDIAMLIGSRNLSADGYDGYTFTRKLMSKAYIRLLGFLGGFRLSDSQCGCKAFRSEAAKDIFGRCKIDSFAFDFECILWAQKFGYKIGEMPVKIINHRESKVRVFKDTVKMLRDVYGIRRRVNKDFKRESK